MEAHIATGEEIVRSRSVVSRLLTRRFSNIQTTNVTIMALTYVLPEPFHKYENVGLTGDTGSSHLVRDQWLDIDN